MSSKQSEVRASEREYVTFLEALYKELKAFLASSVMELAFPKQTVFDIGEKLISQLLRLSGDERPADEDDVTSEFQTRFLNIHVFNSNTNFADDADVIDAFSNAIEELGKLVIPPEEDSEEDSDKEEEMEEENDSDSDEPTTGKRKERDE